MIAQDFNHLYATFVEFGQRVILLVPEEQKPELSTLLNELMANAQESDIFGKRFPDEKCAVAALQEIQDAFLS